MMDEATPGSNRATAPTVPMERHTSDPATRFWTAKAIRCSGWAIKRSVRMERFTKSGNGANVSQQLANQKAGAGSFCYPIEGEIFCDPAPTKPRPQAGNPPQGGGAASETQPAQPAQPAE
jgi:hypothetical protein